jgi:hypothetical protein
MCVDCVLASPRIAQANPGRWTPPRGGSVTNNKKQEGPSDSSNYAHINGQDKTGT